MPRRNTSAVKLGDAPPCGLATTQYRYDVLRMNGEGFAPQLISARAAHADERHIISRCRASRACDREVAKPADGGLAGRLAVRRRLRRALWGGLGGDGSSWRGEARGATCQPPRAAVEHGQPPAAAGASAAARATRQAPYLTCDAACHRARVGGVSCLGNLPRLVPTHGGRATGNRPPVVGGLSHAMSFKCCDTQIPVDASLPLALPLLKKRLFFDCCCIVSVH